MEKVWLGVSLKLEILSSYLRLAGCLSLAALADCCDLQSKAGFLQMS